MMDFKHVEVKLALKKTSDLIHFIRNLAHFSVRYYGSSQPIKVLGVTERNDGLKTAS